MAGERVAVPSLTAELSVDEIYRKSAISEAALRCARLPSRPLSLFVFLKGRPSVHARNSFF